MIEVRRYGATGPHVVLLHGGPGAPGHMAPIARRIAHAYRVLEPFQRGSGQDRLTVRTHIEDLREVLAADGVRHAHLVGSSWGAMLALAFAAAHPALATSLVLIGCGTFDARSRSRFTSNVAERLGPAARALIDGLPEIEPDPDARLRRISELLLPAYSCDLISADLENERVDARANLESWDDMLRLQAEGVYPRAFLGIAAPVLMMHGDRDPHPGPSTRDALLPFLPRLEYHELEKCGHYPWLEREAREPFYERLEEWLRTASAARAAERAR